MRKQKYTEILVGRKPLRRPTHKWINDKMDYGREWEGVDWIHVD
jgi:hypothetical protein